MATAADPTSGACALKRLLKSFLQSVGWYEWSSRAWIAMEPRLINSTRAVTRKTPRLAAAYLAAHATPKLHIGCGDNALPGWLNTELCPRGEQIFLDATRPFPFPDGAFALVYSEHMIEHISHQDGLKMLRECCRVLRPGGIVRIVTPNLAFLTTLLDAEPTPANQAYLEYSIAANRIAALGPSGIEWFNHFMRAWGHHFIYDLPSLMQTVATAGFEGVTPCALSDSGHPELRGLTKIDRMPAPFLEMESIVVEGRTPTR